MPIIKPGAVKALQVFSDLYIKFRTNFLSLVTVILNVFDPIYLITITDSRRFLHPPSHSSPKILIFLSDKAVTQPTKKALPTRCLVLPKNAWFYEKKFVVF